MKKIYWILSTLFFVASCQQPEKVESLSDSVKGEEVKPEVALKIANNFNAFFSVANRKDAKNARTGNKEKTVKKTTSFKDDSGNPLYYVITYNEGGFTIVSAEKKTWPILAFSPFEDFPVEGSFPNGVNDIMNFYKNEIHRARLSNIKSDPKVDQEWKKLETGAQIIPNVRHLMIRSTRPVKIHTSMFNYSPPAGGRNATTTAKCLCSPHSVVRTCPAIGHLPDAWLRQWHRS